MQAWCFFRISLQTVYPKIIHIINYYLRQKKWVLVEEKLGCDELDKGKVTVLCVGKETFRVERVY